MAEMMEPAVAPSQVDQFVIDWLNAGPLGTLERTIMTIDYEPFNPDNKQDGRMVVTVAVLMMPTPILMEPTPTAPTEQVYEPPRCLTCGVRGVFIFKSLAERYTDEPEWVVDEQGDRWVRQLDGRYVFTDSEQESAALSLSNMEAYHGIRARALLPDNAHWEHAHDTAESFDHEFAAPWAPASLPVLT